MSERLGRYGRRLVLIAVVVSAVGGVIYAVTLSNSGSPQPLLILPLTAGLFILGIAIALGVPAAFRRVRGLVRREPGGLGATVLFFFGPLLVLVGMEVIPHAINPCVAARALERPLPEVCQEVIHRGGFGGKGEIQTSVDIRDRWHLLHHALVGGAPLAAVYDQMFRKRERRLSQKSPSGRGPNDGRPNRVAKPSTTG